MGFQKTEKLNRHQNHPIKNGALVFKRLNATGGFVNITK